jgi:tetratricopeptide (TPR) repeat protein
MEKPKGNRRNDKTSGNRSSGDKRRNERRNSQSDRNKRSNSEPENVRKDWGSVTRHGAGKLTREESEDREERNKRTATRIPEDEIPARESSDRLRSEATEAISRAKARKKNTRKESVKKRVPTPNIPHQLPDAGKLLRKLLGEKRGARAASLLGHAAREFEDEKFVEAQKILNSLDEKSLRVAEVVELSGLINYRLGQWSKASEFLESFRRITGSTEQHPVLADCYRAQSNWAEVEILWDELRQASPNAALVTEGRLVMAGALDDQGRTSDAVRILEKGWKVPRHPKEHHLRRAYALGDLYERSGALPRARELFTWIRKHSPKFADVDERVRDLS